MSKQNSRHSSTHPRGFSSTLLLCLALLAALSLPAWAQQITRPAPAVVDVVALRVEFQADTTRFTTGTGRFDEEIYGGLEATIDPLPHDAGYFEAHLRYLEGYVDRVSGGQTVVRTHLVPEIIEVSEVMGAYAPTGPNSESDEETAKLARLVEEAWALADQQSSFETAGFDPATTFFVLFHAGAGRDVELIGTTLDKTPEDIPSLYFDQRALTRLIPSSTVQFKGLPVTNTAVLPETESRLGFDFISDQAFLLELSTNGLLAASFFNYLGVPDLFDTSEGQSAIGPYGLMDPLGIFAYNGLFAPEPSAWTKLFLGWTDPIRATSGETVTLRAGGAPLLVPASATEYFLVEVRHRDPAGDGLLLDIYQNGTIVQQRVTDDTEDFTPTNQQGFLGGTVVGVDDYDWALPGGVDSEDVRRTGGMLVWHIDEQVIAERLEENAINADPSRRGVDLEEADSGQDLGFPNPNPFGPSLDRGSPFDFWFEGNPATAITNTGEVRLYANAFGPDTVPASETNDGSNSLVVLDAFSAAGVEMSVRLNLAEAAAGVTRAIDPAQTNILPRPFDGPGFLARTPNGIVLASGGGLVGRYIEGAGNVLPPVQGFGKPALASRSVFVTGGMPSAPDELLGYSIDDLLADRVAPGQQLALAGPVRGPVRSDGSRPIYLVIPPGAAQIPGFDVGTTDVFYFAQGGGSWLATILSQAVGYELERITPGRSRRNLLTLPLDPTGDALVVESNGLAGVAYEANDNGVITRTDRAGLGLAPASARVEAIGLLGANEQPAFIFADAGFLRAFETTGASAVGFPLRVPGATPESAVRVVRFAGDDQASLLVSVAGTVRAIPERAGFPLSAGGEIVDVLVEGQRVYALTRGGQLAAWDVPDIEAVLWGQAYGDAQNSSYLSAGEIGETPEPESSDLLVRDETYNWPNPVGTDGRTQLRVQVSQPARIDITVADLAGSIVDTFTIDQAPAGIPVELSATFQVASGVYLVSVQAETEAGTTDTVEYKLAVVK